MSLALVLLVDLQEIQLWQFLFCPVFCLGFRDKPNNFSSCVRSGCNSISLGLRWICFSISVKFTLCLDGRVGVQGLHGGFGIIVVPLGARTRGRSFFYGCLLQVQRVVVAFF